MTFNGKELIGKGDKLKIGNKEYLLPTSGISQTTVIDNNGVRVEVSTGGTNASEIMRQNSRLVPSRQNTPSMDEERNEHLRNIQADIARLEEFRRTLLLQSAAAQPSKSSTTKDEKEDPNLGSTSSKSFN